MTAGVHCYDCTCEAMCVGVVSCTYEQWFKLAHVGGIVSFLFLGGGCTRGEGDKIVSFQIPLL